MKKIIAAFAMLAGLSSVTFAGETLDSIKKELKDVGKELSDSAKDAVNELKSSGKKVLEDAKAQAKDDANSAKDAAASKAKEVVSNVTEDAKSQIKGAVNNLTNQIDNSKATIETGIVSTPFLSFLSKNKNTYYLTNLNGEKFTLETITNTDDSYSKFKELKGKTVTVTGIVNKETKVIKVVSYKEVLK